MTASAAHGIACAVLPALPLQLLVRAHPEWRRDPVVVVHEDRANAEVLFINERARERGLLTGMRHGAAQSLVPGLRSGVVAGRELGRAMHELQAGLTALTPRVEPASPGVFFLDPRGLAPLYGDTLNWATTVHRYLVGRGLRASVVVGFGRHRALALARSRAREDVLVVPDEKREIEQCKRLPLEALGASPLLRDGLARLSIHTIGQLLTLPPLELQARFGHEALVLYTMASESPARPFSPSSLDEPAQVALEVDPPDGDVERLLFLLKGGLDRLCRLLRGRSEVLTGLSFTLKLDHAPAHTETLRPASATLDVPLLVDLVRLRLAQASLAAAVTDIVLVAESARAHPRQLAMLEETPRRDLDAAARAIARLRAAFGPECVVRPVLREGHLPEARFAWRAITHVLAPRNVDPASPPPLLRRVLCRPVALPDADPNAQRPALDPSLGPIVRMAGPYRISGGWWARTTSRDYYYLEMGRGDLLWVYRDTVRARWFWQGVVD